MAAVREEFAKAGVDNATKAAEFAKLEGRVSKVKKAAQDARLHHSTLIGQRQLETEKLTKIAQSLRDLQAAERDSTDVTTLIFFFSVRCYFLTDNCNKGRLEDLWRVSRVRGGGGVC
ncbi:hypothetical protein EHS16_07785 [Streptococcus anginosus]|nr:hypothetical protein EHS16_07785 [Streptococcus anginosus]